MKEFEARREAEKVERKQLIMTTGGPTQEPEDVEALQKKSKERKLLTKLSLEAQRDMDKLQIDQKRQIEVAKEKEQADAIAAKHLEARQVK